MTYTLDIGPRLAGVLVLGIVASLVWGWWAYASWRRP